MLTKMVGGSFLTSATGGAFVFLHARHQPVQRDRHGGRWIEERLHQLVHLRRGRGIERGKGNARNLGIAEEDGVIVHIDGGLQLDGHHPDVALAAGRRQGERHARVDLFVVLPVVNLRLVKNQLSAGLVIWRGHPGSCAGLNAAESSTIRNTNKEVAGNLRDWLFVHGSTHLFRVASLTGLRGNTRSMALQASHGRRMAGRNFLSERSTVAARSSKAIPVPMTPELSTLVGR